MIHSIYGIRKSLIIALSFTLNFMVEASKHDSCPSVVKVSKYYIDVYQDRCYVFVDDEMYWTEAKEYCENMTGRLVEVTSYEIMQFLRGRLNSKALGWSKHGVWIGASDTDKDDTWHWTNGEKLHYTNWEEGEPKKSIIGVSFEDCAVMWWASDWRWHDKTCALSLFHYNFICQFDMEIFVKMLKSETVTNSYIITTIEDMETKHGADSGGAPQHGSGDDGAISRGSIIAVVMGLVSLIFLAVCVAVLYVYCKRRYKPPPPYMEEPPLFNNMTCDTTRAVNAYLTRPPSYTPPVDDEAAVYIPMKDMVVTMDDATPRKGPDKERDIERDGEEENMYENDDVEGACGGVDTSEHPVAYATSSYVKEEPNSETLDDCGKETESDTLMDNERNERSAVNLYQPHALFRMNTNSISDDHEHVYEDVAQMDKMQC